MPKILLITGGASGIGAATARRAAAAGYWVAVNYRSRKDETFELVREIESGGGKADAFRANVTRADEVTNLFGDVEARLGTPWALVNSAGISQPKGALADYDPADMEQLVVTNLLGTLYCCREAARHMSVSGGGVIVNVSSMAATTGGRPGSIVYAATKGGVDSMTKGLARELARDGVRVNTVRPGFTRSPMTPQLDDPKTAAAVAVTIPMGRTAEADEVAAPIVWLLSDEASFVTGAFVDISGGGFVIGSSGT